MRMHTDSSTEDLRMNCALDRTLAWRGGGSVRHLLVDLQAPMIRRDRTAAPLPLNLALVIDASGSMAGEPIDAARRAAQGVVETMGPEDTLSLVSFDSHVTTHFRALAMDPDGRRRALREIGRLQAGSMTNLSGGWLAGAEAVAAHMDRHRGLHNRVVLLSDGHANRGICDPEELGRHARELRERGLFSSTVGVGDHYSTIQVEAIANHGGGMMHDAERPEEIVEVVVGELRDLKGLAAENVRLEITVPAGLHLTSVNGFPIETRRESDRTVHTCVAGSILSAGKREAVFRLRCPAGHVGDAWPVDVRVRWTRPGSESEEQTDKETLWLEPVRGDDNNHQRRNERVAEIVARVWQAEVVRRIAGMNRDGDFHASRRYLEQLLPDFRRYCHGLRGGAGLVAELESMLPSLDSHWDERIRKEAVLASHQVAYCQDEYRSAPREKWSDRLRGRKAAES